MQPIVSIKNLCKTYQSGHEALKNINLDIEAGEIIALLGPNGAGKTTLISAICGIVTTTSGSVTVDGFDITKDYRQTRKLIGLVPQELTLGAFEKVANTLAFSRGLFGKKPDPEYLETLLRQLSLWDKKDSALMMLSGGMKRRVLIGKALSHAPKILFLDEPTAGMSRADTNNTIGVLKHIGDTRGITMIIIEHDMHVVFSLADRISVLAQGTVIVEDMPENIKGNPKVQEAYLGSSHD